ncbi:hypothetical protein AB4Y63_19185, partial [Leifsonia sp. YAF41]
MAFDIVHAVEFSRIGRTQLQAENGFRSGATRLKQFRSSISEETNKLIKQRMKRTSPFVFCLGLAPLEAAQLAADRTFGVTRDDYTWVFADPAN